MLNILKTSSVIIVIAMRFPVFLLLLCSVKGSKILAFFPSVSKSHHNVYHPIIEGLAKNGHQITYVTTIKLNTPNVNVTEILIIEDVFKMLRNVDFDFLKDIGKFTTPKIIEALTTLSLLLGDAVFSSKSVQKLIHSDEKFDLILFHTQSINEPSSAFMHKFNAPGVDILPKGDMAWVNELAGFPDNPAYMVDFKSLYTDEMSLLERIHNTYTTIATSLYSYYYLRYLQEQMDQYFNYTGWESRPSIYNLMSDKALILLNSHHSTGYSYPRAPHVKEIGGINIKHGNQLPKDLQVFLDEAKDGAIYFSFGSNLRMSDVTNIGITSSLLKVFGGLKQRILWKWDGDVFPNTPPNIKLGKWFPQQDVLAHKNVKLFITHGGYLSINEAVFHKVPLIGTPFFSDQFKNLKQVTSSGYGITITSENMTEDAYSWAINEILSNPKYQIEMDKISEVFRDRILSPKQEAVYWIEYVLKHKNVLQPYSTKLSFFVVYNLDIYAILVILIYLTLKLFKNIIYLCTTKKRKLLKND